MKKIILLLIFTDFIFLQETYSQKIVATTFNNSNSLEYSNSQAVFLKDSLLLSSQQEKDVAKVYLKLVTGLNRMSEDTVSFSTRSDMIKSLVADEDDALSKILTAKQYQKYRDIINWRSSLKHKK